MLGSFALVSSKLTTVLLHRLGKNATHDMNVVSYEMAPTTLKAFWKQRLRWVRTLMAQRSPRHRLMVTLFAI